MKNRTRNLFAALALLALPTLNPQLSTCYAQGNLTPPGAPAPTMKSLDQIYTQIGAVSDQRIAVNAANTPGDQYDSFVISQPGSYYLTGNITGVSSKNGIEIAANNVTLDLNGFAMQGVSGATSGIYISTQTNITVRNGAISGWAGGDGVESDFASSFNLVFEHLNVSACGGMGIFIGGAAIVRDCNCKNNGGGFQIHGGILSGCTAYYNAGDGFYATSSTMSGCTAYYNANDGFVVVSSTMSGCTANENSIGVEVDNGTVSGCLVQNNTQMGIYVNAPGSVVIGNNCAGNNTANLSSSAGIYIFDARNRIEDNHVTANGTGTAGAGISVSSSYSDNIIIKNSVSGYSGNNYLTPGTQIVGPIITTTGTITSTSPWANFSF